MCSSCAVYINSLLKKDVDIKKNEEPLYTAAAALAYYRYTLAMCASDGSSTFSAGDVKVSLELEKTCDAARRLRDEALKSIAFLCEPQDFFTVSTEGGAI